MTLDFLGNLQRTHMCGELRSSDAGTTVTLMGWVNRRRDHGNLIFLDVRDRTGITQIVLDKEVSPAAHIRLFNTALGGGIALTIDALWQALATRLGRAPNHFRTIGRL